MTTPYLDIIAATAKTAKEQITSLIERRGTNYELINPQDMEDDKPDEFYQLPRTIYYGKYNIFEEYVITTINISEGVITFEGLSIDGETQEVNKTFAFDDLDSITICHIADVIDKLEN